MFISKSLHPTAAKYTSFEDFPSDHRSLSIDLDIINALGNKTPASVCPNTQRLKLRDPKAANEFLSDYKITLHKYKLINQIFALQGKCPKQKQIPVEDEIDYKKIDKR